MTVYWNERRGRWMYDFQRDGKRHNRYCLDAAGAPVKSQREAEEAEGVAMRAAGMAPKVARVSDLTLAQVVGDLTPQWEGTADWPNKQRYLREILAYFGPGKRVADISEADLEDYRTWALKQPLKTWTGGSKRRRDDPYADRYWKDTGRTRSTAIVNRYLPVLRAVFDRAHKIRDPLTGRRALEEIPTVADLQEPKRKARPIPEAVLLNILASAPAHVVEAMIATLYFGFRQSEIFERTVVDVDFEHGGIWLSAEHVKDNEDAFIPGADEAMAFMRKLVDQANARKTKHLITWRRTYKDAEAQAAAAWMPIKEPKTAWRTIMDKVETKFGRRYRWHDIRAAYISYVAIKSGGPVAQALARHSDLRTTQAYIHVADSFQREGANRAAERPALKVVR